MHGCMHAHMHVQAERERERSPKHPVHTLTYRQCQAGADTASTCRQHLLRLHGRLVLRSVCALPGAAHPVDQQCGGGCVARAHLPPHCYLIAGAERPVHDFERVTRTSSALLAAPYAGHEAGFWIRVYAVHYMSQRCLSFPTKPLYDLRCGTSSMDNLARRITVGV